MTGQRHASELPHQSVVSTEGADPGKTERAASEGLGMMVKASNAAATDSGPDGQFPWFVHQYLRDYIALADQKAGFVFAVVAALIAYLVDQNAVVISGRSATVGFIGVTAVFMLTTAAAFAIATIAPRLRRGLRAAPGLIFWEDVASYPSDTEYAIAAGNLSGPKAAEQVLKHSHVLSKIAVRKYRHLNRAIVCGAIGFAFAVVFIVLK